MPMKPIGLTGHPDAQSAVAMQLAALISRSATPVVVLLGVESVKQAYAIHHDGGEVWHCGPYAPLRDLVGQVDRVLPGTTFEDIAPQVQQSLQELLTKHHITGEPA